MNNLVEGTSGDLVKQLQALLNSHGANILPDGQFGLLTAEAVKIYQKQNGLTADGIVGPATWNKLTGTVVPEKAALLTEQDMSDAAAKLGIETAALKAVREVETGGRSGFLSNGDPVILFEGHIFWRQLVQRGINPVPLAAANADILYVKWTTAFYKRGIAEYGRLNRAIAINKEAAYSSASWGLFQIMGFNHKACGYDTVTAYVEDQYKGEKQQLFSFTNFLRGTPALTALRNKDWAAFAKAYNGADYAKNKYDLKLAAAYKKYA